MTHVVLPMDSIGWLRLSSPRTVTPARVVAMKQQSRVDEEAGALERHTIAIAPQYSAAS